MKCCNIKRLVELYVFKCRTVECEAVLGFFKDAYVAA
jgi:hypothetical protein